MIKELIEQMGGRERLEFIAEDCAEARFSEIETMARALLAVLDAKPTYYIHRVEARDSYGPEPGEWDAFEAISGCKQAAHKARLCYAAMLAAAPAPEDKK